MSNPSGKTVLMVTSWYPSRLNKTEGNFVERHANALREVGFEVLIVHLKYSNRVLVPVIEKHETSGFKIIHHFIPRYYLKLGSLRRMRFLSVLSEIKRCVSGELYMIHGNVLYPSGELATYLKSALQLPIVFTEHSSIYQPQNIIPLPPKFKSIVRATLAELCCFLPVSENLGFAVQAMGFKTQFKVVNNAVDTSLFKFENPKNTEEFTFLHVSHLGTEAKNTVGILSAFSKFRSETARLVIAGDGGTNHLFDFMKSEGIDDVRIQILGSQTYEEVAALMKSSHCHVLFSNYENLPCVIAESHCCGVPVIATTVGGIPEMINEANGLLISPKDEEALTTAFEEMQNAYQNYDRKAIAETAKNRYSYKAIGEAFHRIYQECWDSR
jgi:glycosyltransferase involved in cell wall biosynthesis